MLAKLIKTVCVVPATALPIMLFTMIIILEMEIIACLIYAPAYNLYF